MEYKTLSFFVIVLLIKKGAYAQSEEVCLTRRDYGSSPSTEMRQGRPGKIGPMGPPGAKGQHGHPGAPGTCVCDQDLEEIRNKLQNVRVYSCGVGMRDGSVGDSYLSSSSIHSNSWNANRGRLDELHHCWHTGATRSGEWIQVDLQTPVRVTAVVTQGRPTAFNQYITSFKIQFGNDADNLETIENSDGTDMVFQGNTDFHSHKVNEFPQPITARYFRLVVQSWHGNICMRMEYLTC